MHDDPDRVDVYGKQYTIRSDVSDGCIARVFFCFDEAQIVLLHAFIKKTQKTPAAELATARKRAKLTKG